MTTALSHPHHQGPQAEPSLLAIQEVIEVAATMKQDF
jgi:hypothetical protein